MAITSEDKIRLANVSSVNLVTLVPQHIVRYKAVELAPGQSMLFDAEVGSHPGPFLGMSLEQGKIRAVPLDWDGSELDSPVLDQDGPKL